MMSYIGITSILMTGNGPGSRLKRNGHPMWAVPMAYSRTSTSMPRINAAYIVIGLLYGEGDFGKTVDISTRCGQDSDCNPASSGGILGTVLGYSNIPEYWKQGIEKVEDMDFKYTSISLKDAYEMSHRHAVEMIKKNGGKEEGDRLTILLEKPEPVRFEKAFDGHFPVQRMDFGWDGKKLESDGALEYSFDFKGIGFVLLGRSQKLQPDKKDLDLLLDVYIDGELYEQALLPTYYLKRRNELTWKYNLTDDTHNVRIVWRNPTDGYGITMADVLVYGPQPVHSSDRPAVIDVFGFDLIARYMDHQESFFHAQTRAFPPVGAHGTSR